MINQPSQLPAEVLVAFALGELDDAQARQVETAAAQSPEVARGLRHVRDLLAVLQEGVLASVPRESLVRAFGVWQSARQLTLAEWLGQTVERAMSVLFDSGATPALAGFRGGSESRHVSFRAGDVEIELLVDTDAGRATIQGQVVGTEVLDVAAFSPVTLAMVGQSGGDDDGGFRLNLPASPCDLRVRTGQGVFALHGVIKE